MGILLGVLIPVWGGILATLLFGIGAIWYLYRVYMAICRYHRMVAMKPINMDSMRPGPVEVYGKAEAIEKLEPSPWSRSPSIIYNFKVEHYCSDGKRESWEEYLDDWHRPATFRLKDDTGVVTIKVSKGNLESGKVQLSDQAHVLDVDRTSSGFQEGLPTQISSEKLNLKKLLKERYNKNTEGWFLKTDDLRYTESFLQEGDEIYVYGEAKEVGGQWEISGGKEPLIINEKGEYDAESNMHSSYSRYILNFFICILAIALFLVLSGIIEIKGLNK